MTQESKILIIIGVITLAIIGGGTFFLDKSSTKQPTPAAKVDQNILVRPDSNKTGSDSAKVTLVEFADFQCPACGVAYPTVKQVRENYQGKINFVFRHFPLPQHKNGLKAAEAVEAAGEQGKFWEMDDKLFTNQDKWGESTNAMDYFLTYAKEIGLDTDKFKASVDANKFAEKIKKDQQDGVAAGVNSTPTFFINGSKIVGAPTYEEFKTQIDAELSK